MDELRRVVLVVGGLNVTLAVLLCCVVLLWCWRAARGLPPGPCGLPLVGYLPWLDPSAPHLTLTRLVERYGRVLSLRMGGVLVVVMADPHIVRDTLSSKHTSGRAPLYLTHGIMKGYGLICSEGELWREHRKFVLGLMRGLGMRTAAKRGAMEPRIHSAAVALVQELRGSEGGVDVSARLLHHVGNVMNELIFGLTYRDDDFTWQWLRHLLEEGTKLIGVAGPLNFLPWLRFLPKYRRTISFITENQRLTHKEYQAIIERYQKALLAPHPPHQGREEALEEDEEGLKETREGQEERPEWQEKGQRRILEGKREGREWNGEGQWVTTDGQEEGREWKGKGQRKTWEEMGKEESERQEVGKSRQQVSGEEIAEGRKEGQEEWQETEQNGKLKGKDLHEEEANFSGPPLHLVDAYLKERRCRAADVGSFTLTQLHHVAADLFGAGSETTITTLKWHLLNMALYPELQQHVHDELDRHSAKEDPVTLAEADLFPYTQATLLETQRLRSIIPLGVPHGATQELTVGGYRVPRGSMLLPLLWSIHHDPSTWTDPNAYVPERFLDHEGRVTKNLAFMPFQTGRRMCIGDEFAKMVMFIFTASLLKYFKVGLGEDVVGDPASDPVCGFSLSPRPFTLTFTPRD